VLRLIPVGKAGLIEYDNVPMPPAPLTGLNEANAIVLVNEYEDSASVVVTSGASTVKVNVWLLVARLTSVTVTVWTVAILETLGVPVICPVDELKLNPVGNAGLILNTLAPSPPVAVTGVNAEIAVPCVNVLVAIACVVASGDEPESTVNVKVVLPVFPA
jgi:hypothetical protein